MYAYTHVSTLVLFHSISIVKILNCYQTNFNNHHCTNRRHYHSKHVFITSNAATNRNVNEGWYQ